MNAANHDLVFHTVDAISAMPADLPEKFAQTAGLDGIVRTNDLGITGMPANIAALLERSRAAYEAEQVSRAGIGGMQQVSLEDTERGTSFTSRIDTSRGDDIGRG